LSQTNRVYAAITGDVIGSTKLYEKTGKPVRPILQAALARANERLGDLLVVPFSITIGDEFQGLVQPWEHSPIAVFRARLALYPLRCRMGVGIGSVAGGLAATTTLMEGPAFNLARDALNTTSSSRVTVFRADEPRVTQATDVVWRLADVVTGSWSDKQWEAAQLFAVLGDMTAVARKLQVTKQAIHERLKSARYHELVESLTGLGSLLQTLSAA
jgi:hypothetical protein